MSAHRYWRLLVPPAPDGRPLTVVYINEVELRASIGGIDATGSGTAFANYSNSGAPALAFDNVNTTYFGQSVSTGFVTLTYDFGSGNDKDIQQVVMIAGSDTYASHPTKFYLQYSDDNKSYRTIYSTNTLSWAASETKTFNIVPNLSAKISDTAILSKALFVPNDTKAVPFSNNSYDALSLKRLGTIAYFGSYKIAGSTTVLGIPAAKRVQLHEQRTGQIIGVRNTQADGSFLFNEIPPGLFTVIGVDETGQQNSVIYAHVNSVPG